MNEKNIFLSVAFLMVLSIYKYAKFDQNTPCDSKVMSVFTN